MKISFDAKGLDAIQARLRGLSENKINVAVVAALNSAAYAGSQETKREMRRVFDRPTPWVLGGVRYKKATRQNMESQIDFDKWGNKTGVTVEKSLNAQIFGGARRNKRHEVALQRAGILPAGYSIVPGQAAQMDAYGGMRSQQIIQIIAWFKAFGEQGYRANMTDKTQARLGKDKVKKGQRGFQYFAIRKTGGHLVPGIYQRIQTGFGSAIKPVMIFVKGTSYRKRLDFYTVARVAAEKEFKTFFPKYLNQLLAERGL